MNKERAQNSGFFFDPMKLKLFPLHPVMFNSSETLTLTLGCSFDADYLQNKGGFSRQFPMSLLVSGDDVSRGLFPVIGWKMAANTTIVH